MKKISLFVLLFGFIAACGGSGGTPDGVMTVVGNVALGGVCADDSECADGLVCESSECVESAPADSAVDGGGDGGGAGAACQISGTLTLPGGVDAAGEQYAVTIDENTVVDLNEAALLTGEWGGGSTQSFLIDVNAVDAATYYIYAAVAAGEKNYIGYFGGVGTNPPAAANAGLGCDDVYDVALEEVVTLKPDYKVAAASFTAEGIGGQNFTGGFTITNSGDAAGSENVQWKVYLSGNATLEPGSDTLADEGTVSALGIGELSSSNSFSLTWPDSGGTRYLIIYIAASDDDNPGNNIAVSDAIAVVVPKRAIAVGGNGTILYSDDFGKTWTSVNSGTTSILRAAAHSKSGRWVVSGYDGAVRYSTDKGLTWTGADSKTTNRLNGVVSFGTNSFVAVGEPSNFDPYGLVRSVDGGVTWERRATMVTLHGITVRGTNDLAAVGHTYSTYEGYVMLTYTGGDQWGDYYLQSKPPLYDVVHTIGRFVAVGQQISMYSPGGGDWKTGATNPEVPTTMYGIAWSSSPGRLVAVGQSGKIIYGGSSGTSWTTAVSGTDKMLYDVATDDNGRFIAVGYDGTIIYSHDAGVTWSPASSGTGQILWGVAYSK